MAPPIHYRPGMPADAEIEAPLALFSERVRREWIDYNGHMNVAFYVLAFDHATDAFFEILGIGQEYRETQNASTFAVESHVCYLRELHEGDLMRFTTQLLGHDDKRLHYFHHMYHGEKGHLAATLESLSLHVDMTTRRVSPMPGFVRAQLDRISAAHRVLPWPKQAGSVVAVSRKAEEIEKETSHG